MIFATVNNKEREFVIDQQDDHWMINGKRMEIDIHKLPSGMISVLSDNRSYTLVIEKIKTETKEITLTLNGNSYDVVLREEIDVLLSKMGIDLHTSKKLEPVKAPMPGLVLKVLVEEGQQIKKRDGLIILEAMKMENILKATSDARVKKVHATPQKAVEKGTILIELE